MVNVEIFAAMKMSVQWENRNFHSYYKLNCTVVTGERNGRVIKFEYMLIISKVNYLIREYMSYTKWNN